ADLGSFFSGALLIQSFASQGDSIVASGVVTGALMGIGTFRNLVIQVTLPLDLNASRAGLNTDATLAQTSCDVLHVELGGTSINVLGSTMGLNPVAFDIASPVQISTGLPPVQQFAPAPTAAARRGTVPPAPRANPTQVPVTPQAQPSTPAAPAVSAPTAQPSTPAAPAVSTPTAQPSTPAAPAVNTPTAQPSAPANTPTAAASQTPLAAQLCSVNGFRDVSNPTQVAQQLNGILAALGGKQAKPTKQAKQGS